MSKPKVVEAGDFKFTLVDHEIHRWPKEGSAAFGGTQQVPDEELQHLPRSVQDLLLEDDLD
ncbi:MAG: hypothetical protein NT019_00240 [Candidatus Adlerbacteria bacterium]|nr:hypothetical protein [Candidatus Adlerbacteria bacterium]